MQDTTRSWATTSAPRGAEQPSESQSLEYAPGGPYRRSQQVIGEFWGYYREYKRDFTDRRGLWETHFENVARLHSLLEKANVAETHPSAWDIVSLTEKELQSFFGEARRYGPLSPSVLDRVARVSREIGAKCRAVESELKEYLSWLKGTSPENRRIDAVRKSIVQFKDIQKELNADLRERHRHDQLLRETRELWRTFLRLHTVLAVQRSYRPALQDLNRLHLNEDQERFVALDYQGHYRIHGASGSGKTIILIHRALRLAEESPAHVVRVFTINRALAELLRATALAIHGSIPDNLHVAAFYDFLLQCVEMFEPLDRYRLADDRSGERITVSWRDFTEQPRNVFASPVVRALVRSIEGREALTVDAQRYLRDEMVYIQSGYRLDERDQYLKDPRRQRAIPLTQAQRKTCLTVLTAWEEYLRVGGLCDIDGLTLTAAQYMARKKRRKQTREAHPTTHVLIDEAQDFSSLELWIAKRLVVDPADPNRFFLAGDLHQKVYAKHYLSRRADFSFRGRSANLARNYRNTKQILQAAYCVAREFPPPAEDDLEIIQPEYSIYDGGRPVVLECRGDAHAARIVEIAQIRTDCRVAIVSENEGLLEAVDQQAKRDGQSAYVLLRNEDLDRWLDQQENPFSAHLVLARLEAVKGYEFDTVIVCDLSDGVVPSPGTPQEEYWRHGAIVYSALTRARDELIITYVGRPSVFLDGMASEVDSHEAIDDTPVRAILGLRGEQT